MITRRTKVQLLVFALITALGVAYVGARYARLDRLVRDDSYAVTAHFAEAGGIFAGAEVTYRGVGIGTVDRLELTRDGVDVVLEIDNAWDKIPQDSIALVGNRSAVGEQYVELQPQVDDGALLEEGSEIPVENTRTPIQTETLLADLATTVGSVDQDALRTTVEELGKAFDGTGEDLQQIIDTSNSFIETADANFETTTKLIEDANVVLRGQLAKQTSLRQFASQLALFSESLADADPDLRKLLDDGSFGANQLRGLIEDNRVELGSLINNLITTGEVVVKNLNGIQQVFVIYPYVVEGGFTVVSKSPDTGLYDAHFGAIITTKAPCYQGYEGTDRRPPQDGENRPMNVDARCTEPPSQSNARGAQNLPPRPATSLDQAPVVASYDPETGELTWADETEEPQAVPGTVAPASLGRESWKWLYLEPMTGR